MNIEEQTNENTRNISSLTTSVTELAAMFKYSEKARDEERLDVKAAVAELKALNDKISTMASMQKEVTDLASDLRALTHDFKNVQNSMIAITLLKDKQVEGEKKSSNHETRIDAIEKWKDNSDGAKGVVKIIIHFIWAFASVGGFSVVAWLVSGFYKAGGHIGGE